MLRKCISALLMAFLLLSAVPVQLLAAEDQLPDNMKRQFPDVANDHWAVKFITKMGLRGVILGDMATGNFMPNDPLTQLQAIIMVINNMNLKEEVETKDSSRVLPFEVPDWGKKYVLTALDRGLIKLDEDRFRYDAEASREWVSHIIVRMIDKEDGAMKLAGTSSDFSDADSISAWALGYVNETARLGIVSGMPGNLFAPKETVTRAQMVTFLSKADPYLEQKSERSVTGTVISLNDRLITIDQNGIQQTFEIVLDAPIYTYKDARQTISLSDIQLFNEVNLIVYNGKAYFVELTDDSSQVETVSGKFVSLYLEEGQILIQDDQQKIIPYTLTSTVSVIGVSGEGSSLTSLNEGDKLELSVNPDGQVLSIAVKEAATNITKETYFRSADETGKTIVVSDENNESIEVYSYTELPSFSGAVDFSRLGNGDRIRIVVKDSVLTGIELIKKNPRFTYEGTIVSVGQDAKVITFLINGEYRTFEYGAQTEIKLTGLGFPQISDLKAGDAVEISGNEQLLEQILVKDREVINYMTASIVAIDKTNRILTYRDAKDQLQAKEIGKLALVEYDGVNVNNLDVLVKGMKVELEIEDDQIILIKHKNRVDGKIVKISPEQNLVQIELPDGVKKLYTLSPSVYVEIRGQTNETIRNLQAGNDVQLRLEPTGETANAVYLKKPYFLKVSQLNLTTNQLTLVDEANNSATYSMSNQIPLFSADSNPITLPGLKTGEIVKSYYVGDTIKSVQQTETYLATVDSLDLGSGLIAAKTFGGKSLSINTDQKTRFKTTSGTAISLNAIGVGDRIQVKWGLNGSYEITVAYRLPSKVIYFNQSRNTLETREIGKITVTSRTLASDTYIHQGDTLISAKSLVPGDEVDLYLIDGKLIEIDKK